MAEMNDLVIVGTCCSLLCKKKTTPPIN